LSTSDIIKYRKRILNGAIIPTTIWLAWPIILANIINISYNLVDAFWLGKVGQASFAAPTVSWPLIMLFYSLGMGLSFAGVTLVSQYVGAGDKLMARKSAGYLIGFMLMLATTISIAGFIASPYILRFMGVPEDVLPLAIGYIRVIFAGIPIAFVGFAFNSILNGIGDTRTPTILGAIASGVNVVLDPVLIFGWWGFPALGATGAALATVTSRSIVSVIGILLLIRGFRGIKIGLNDLFFDRAWLKKVAKIGIPLSIQQSANSLGFVVMMSLVSRLGTAVIATYGIGIRIIDVIQAFTWGIMRATSIMIGQNIGAEKYDRAEQIVYRNMILLFIALSLGAAFIYVFRIPLITAFINDPIVINEGSRFLTTFLPSMPFFGLFFLVGAVARGSGHTVPFTVISIIRLWALRIGLSILLTFYLGFGALGIWMAMAISNFGAGLMSIAWMSRGTWKRRVIEVPVKTVIDKTIEQPINGD
jgi:putative MATE family efflux protein